MKEIKKVISSGAVSDVKELIIFGLVDAGGLETFIKDVYIEGIDITALENEIVKYLNKNL